MFLQATVLSNSTKSPFPNNPLTLLAPNVKAPNRQCTTSIFFIAKESEGSLLQITSSHEIHMAARICLHIPDLGI